jgi:hypothetical protein
MKRNAEKLILWKDGREGELEKRKGEVKQSCWECPSRERFEVVGPS